MSRNQVEKKFRSNGGAILENIEGFFVTVMLSLQLLQSKFDNVTSFAD